MKLKWERQYGELPHFIWKANISDEFYFKIQLMEGGRNGEEHWLTFSGPGEMEIDDYTRLPAAKRGAERFIERLRKALGVS